MNFFAFKLGEIVLANESQKTCFVFIFPQMRIVIWRLFVYKLDCQLDIYLQYAGLKILTKARTGIEFFFVIVYIVLLEFLKQVQLSMQIISIAKFSIHMTP